MLSKVRTWKLLALAALISVFASTAFADVTPTDYSFNVSLRGTGSATIHTSIYTNPLNIGVTVLAVHGFTERATVFAPLANAIFSDQILKFAVKRIISVDLVGHGGSSFPSNLPSPTKFGDLTIEDNISTVIQAIDNLRAHNMGPKIIMGHSMGGLTVQGVQEALLAQNSSLAAHGVVGAILIAAVPNAGTAWTQPPPSDLSQFLVNDPTLGLYINVPASVEPFAGGFTRISDGTLIPGATTTILAAFVANNWAGPEPLTTTLELVGTNPPTRPFVRQNAFAPSRGTILTVLSFSQDALVPAVDQPALYTYLTGLQNTGATLYRPIVAADAVHSMYISNPTGLLSVLRNGIF